ncbi:MAG: hypothetical protein HXL12_00230 [Candidatus Nanosynbacter sp.]|nr:hypothetical protein [Candidatus Nanosynbacter sp.]
MTECEVEALIRKFHAILEPDFPEWLQEYIETPVLQRQKHISITCGTIYSDLFKNQRFYSSLDHAVGVALVVWHFTHDKKQTLSGLFHDIATPIFKHCVDFMNGDHLMQESTEDLTKEMIAESPGISCLLKRDGILISEVDDYHLYPIADNNTPKLSADRLEYSLVNMLFAYGVADLVEIREIYADIVVQLDENGVKELGFQTKKIARKFVKLTSQLSIFYREDRTRYSMQFLADILKKMSESGRISVADLYQMKESEVIEMILASDYRDAFLAWQKAKKIKKAKSLEQCPDGVYVVNCQAKVRYIDPLWQGERMSKACKIAKNYIEKNLAYKMEGYLYLPGLKLT